MTYISAKKAFNYADYKNYLKSTDWRMVRNRYLASDLPQSCWACDKPVTANFEGFNLHHRTYTNLFNEELRDLILLCRADHAELEAELKPLKAYGETVESWTRKFIILKRDALGLSMASLRGIL